MASYFTKFLPQLGDNGGLTNSNSPYYDTKSTYNPQLKYLSVFNPSLIENSNAETSEELFQQIICFISSNSQAEGNQSLSEEEKIEQLKIIGLIRGVNSFAVDFNNSKDNDVTIINSSKSSIILINIESEYFLACSISFNAKHNNKSNFTNHQLIKLIKSFYRNFVIQNTSFGNIVEKYQLPVLKQLLLQYWQGFYFNYNSQYYKIPPGLSWPNSLNYKGFLGLLPSDRLYKRSSLSLNFQATSEISNIVQGDSESIPKGIIISYFNKLFPKKYGLLHVESNPKLSENELIDIYSWLEFHDYHQTLTTEALSNINFDENFKSNLSVIPDLESETSSTANSATSSGNFQQITTENLRAVTSTALEMLNPRNITPNLAISPINYTVNTMLSIGDQVKHYGTGIVESVEEVTSGGWLSVPPLLKNLSLSGAGNTENETIVENAIPNDDDDDEIEEENTGEYLIGSKFDLSTNTNTVFKKLVYLKTKVDDNKEEEREYQLVIFKKDDIILTLVYESGWDQLDNIEFYETLAQDTLSPAIDEIDNSVLGASIIGTSVGSLNGIIRKNELDNDFFFIVFDKEEGWIKSSLPYLPHINLNEEENKPLIRYQSAIFYLHDQLTSLFLMQRNNNFFTHNKMGEYFHKFTSNKQNDWMFYYIKHKGKFIIIIKNRNHSTKKKRKSIAYRKLSVVPPSITSNMSSPISNGHEQLESQVVDTSLMPELDDGILHRISDYAHLGFLDNLGDDVKYWLAEFSSTSAT
ncbi:uncharacterized protein RJT21DRAFT_131647 [Scheffersomyces amazonensis]|uniref:uncharacterized protein n=1 Tax=Scheffersomyces amazonensis TaxID=1078765 RepID=UPI00315CB6EF